MRGIVALAAMALMLTACSGNTNTPTLVPGGWGDTPPSRDAIEKMAQWVPVHIFDIKAAIVESSQAMGRFDRQKSPDVNAAKAECQDMTQPLINELSAHLPTPEPDLTNALQVVIDDAGKVGTNCAKALTDPSTPNKYIFYASVHELRSDFSRAGQIMVRDGKILTAAGF